MAARGKPKNSPKTKSPRPARAILGQKRGNGAPLPASSAPSLSAPIAASTPAVHAVTEYRLRLDGIRFRGHHGVSDSERALPQDFLVSLEAHLPLGVLPSGDAIADVFNYDRLATLVVEEGTRQKCRLLETLAQRVIARILADTPATRVSVAVTKSRPPTRSSVDSVTVELRATRG